MRRAVSLLLVLHALVAAVLLARNLRQKFSEARGMLGTPTTEARRRVLGPALAEVADRVRSAVPEDGAYAVVDAARSDGSGYWLRYDLAPRLALLVDGGAAVDPRTEAASVPWVVVLEPPPGVPRLVGAGAYFGGDSSHSPGREDDGIPAAIDGPEADGVVTGDLVVRGWCQERGGRPCPEFRFFVDGKFLEPDLLERHARPDVARAVPGIGPASSAGYRAVLRIPPGPPGTRSLSVVFMTADGRFRRLGPRAFRWEPK